ncbi:MAG: trypsin-like peptidase domain-containing protein [Solirubrobacteraceae bacterium]|nr:trypsin-like peptidase domain-containing protein [Patulibacter sp.]
MASLRPSVLRPLALALALAGATGLAACGSDGNPGGSGKAKGNAASAAATKAAQVPAATGSLTEGAVKGGLPSVVAVSVTDNGTTRTGTGTLLAAGAVVTEARLVTAPNGLPVAGITVREGNGEEHAGTVDGIDKLSGLAVINVRDLTAVPVAKPSAEPVELGEEVVSLGFLGARRPAMRPGTVVTTDRSVRRNGDAEVGLFEATTSLGAQGIGGPMVDETGRVVGIVTKGLASMIPGTYVGIPVTSALRIVKALHADGTVRRPYLGVDTLGVTPSRAEELHLSTSTGVLLRSIAQGSPAEYIGLKKPTGTTEVGGRVVPTGGDVIVAIDGTRIEEPEGLYAAINAMKPGQRITLHVIRGNHAVTLHATLAEH